MKTRRPVTVHRLARHLEGPFTWPLPLCWDAEQRERGHEPDDDLWWVSVDHDAIDPTEIVATVDPAAVTCRDCHEWMHA